MSDERPYVTGHVRYWHDPGNTLRKFRIDLPDGANVKFVAEQGALIVQSAHGMALAAIREVKDFHVDGLIDIEWTLPEAATSHE